MRFDKARMGEPGFEGAQDWIEALNVADLQNQSVARGKLRQFSGVLWIFGNWFFNEQMFPALQKWKGNFVMRIGRCRD